MQLEPIQVSLIVPVYNNPKDLVECISALKAEAYPGSEIIVVDDGSTDKTGSVAAGLGVMVLKIKEGRKISTYQIKRGYSQRIQGPK